MTLRAFLLSPLIVAVVAFVEYCLVQRIYSHADFSPRPLIVLFIYCCLFSLPPAYLAELLLGLPAWLIFRHYRIRSVPVYVTCGALIGLIAAHILSLYFFQSWIDWVEYLLSPARWMNLSTSSAVIGGAIAAALFSFQTRTPSTIDRISPIARSTSSSEV